MSNCINLIAFGTFGNPNGFKQSFYGDGNDNQTLAKSIKTFDLNTNAIKLFDQTLVYAIRKEYAGGFNAVAYSVYTFAKEQGSDRGGTFIGSSILFSGKIADENIVLRVLNEFHNNLTSKNVRNGIITVKHSNDFSGISKPKDFDKMSLGLRAVEDLNYEQTNKNLVVYCKVKPETLQSLFKKSLDLLNVYDAIYFTSSQPIAEFVHQKGIFKLVQVDGFEQEIQNLQEERRKKIQSTLDRLEREKSILNDERKKLEEEALRQLEFNKKIHKENEKRLKEADSALDIVGLHYSDFSKKIEELITQLKSGKKLDDVKRLYSENRNAFNEKLNAQTTSVPISRITIPAIKSSGSNRNKSIEFSNKRTNEGSSSSEIWKYLFPIATVAFLLLWVGTLVYFSCFVADRKSQSLHTSAKEEIETQNTNPASHTTTKKTE